MHERCNPSKKRVHDDLVLLRWFSFFSKSGNALQQQDCDCPVLHKCLPVPQDLWILCLSDRYSPRINHMIYPHKNRQSLLSFQHSHRQERTFLDLNLRVSFSEWRYEVGWWWEGVWRSSAGVLWWKVMNFSTPIFCPEHCSTHYLATQVQKT